MRFVDNDRVVFFEQRIGLGFRKENAVGHQLDGSAERSDVGEAHLVAHHLTGLGVQFLSNAFSDGTCGNTPRLSVTDKPLFAAPRHQTDFRKLRGLPRPRFTADDDHLVISYGLHKQITLLTYGQPRR